MDIANSPRKPLSELIGNLGYAAPAEKRSFSGESTTKRRKIELADPSTLAVLSRKPEKPLKEQTTAPKRPKAPRKKPQTVTAVATAAYQPPKPPGEPGESVSKLFTPEKDQTRAKKPRKPRTKPTEASTTTTKKPGRPKKAKVTFNEPPPPLLYTPMKATRQAESQDFLFGTSSQLAQPESPSFIRQMQAAMLESELIPATQALTVSPNKRSCAKVPTAPHGTSLSVGQAAREHWCAATRDFKGGLLREKSGLRPLAKKQYPKTAEVSVRPVERPPVPAPTPAVPEKTGEAPSAQEGSFMDIDDVRPPPPAALPEKPTAPPSAKADSFIDIDDISDHEAPPTPSPPRRKASASPTPVRPLTFEITGSPSRAATKVHSPPPAKVQLKIGLSSTAVLKATDPQWPSIKARLFPHITSTVKSSPRSTDPANPSWHQKILLYDPIVLEDLTAWLNQQGIRINVQRQKTKKTAKGGKKKKTATEGSDEAATMVESGGQKVEIAQEEVKEWMVQKWCEEKSVCCLWKEGMRGGVKSRY